MTVTNQPTNKGGKPPASPANRLPSTRERRPALAALAVLLIAGGAVLAGWLALREAHTETYLVVSKTVEEGTKISGDDIREIELPSGSANFIPAGEIEDVVDAYAQTTLLEETVLAEGMVGDAPDIGDGDRRIGLHLEPGQFPLGIAVGDQVVVELLPGDEDSTTPDWVTAGVIRQIKQSDTGGTSVDVVVSAACADNFQAGGSNGDVALSLVSPAESAAPPQCQPGTPPSPPRGNTPSGG